MQTKKILLRNSRKYEGNHPIAEKDHYENILIQMGFIECELINIDTEKYKNFIELEIII